MSPEEQGEGLDSTQDASTQSDRNQRKDEPIEEAEKDLSRYSTSDSRPPLGEQERTTVQTEAQESARHGRDEDPQSSKPL